MYSVHDTPCGVGFPIRKFADQRSLASPRDLSQRATSFIAFWRQGIHRTPLSCSILPITVRAQDQTAPNGLSPSQADPSHSGRQGHSTQFHTHWMTSQPHHQSSRPSAAADHHPPNPIHRLKEHAQHPGKAQGRKLLREVDTTLRRCRFHEGHANQAYPQTTSRGGQQTKSAATTNGG